MRRTFKFRIKPNKTQTRVLDGLLEAARSLYNAALEQRITEYRSHHRNISYFGQCVDLKEARLSDEDLMLLGSQACQDVLRRLDKAYKAFFRRLKRGEAAGFPRFKSKDRYSSITFPQYPTGAKLGLKWLYIQNVGQVRINQHRALSGRIKTTTIIREASGKWYACFSCDNVPARTYPPTMSEVGIDVGINHFATLSTGEAVENPRWYRATEAKLGKAQQVLSAKKRGSAARRKARKNVARLHAHAHNQRKDFQHKLSHRIVSENAFIAVEDLHIDNMIEKSYSGMCKSILDASWSSFLTMLSYKAEEAGRFLVRVPPQGTSQCCSDCGVVVVKSLKDRTHSCPACGLVLDRDHNAALNILGLGRSLAAKGGGSLGL
jgi:putative transposase